MLTNLNQLQRSYFRQITDGFSCSTAVSHTVFCTVFLFFCSHIIAQTGNNSENTEISIAQKALEKLQDGIDTLTSKIAEKPLGKPLTAVEKQAAEALLDESETVLNQTDISDKFRLWTTGRRIFALIHLAYTDKPKYFSTLNEEFDTLQTQKGTEKYAKMAEEHILRIAIGLAIQPVVMENGKKFGVDAQELTDWLIDYAERYPGRESSSLLESFIVQINEIPNRFQRDRLLSLVLPAIVDHFRASDNPLDIKTAQRWAAAARRISLPGNPMKLTGFDINAEPFNINWYKGKAVLVVFWGTWCIHCREETQRLIELYGKYRSKGFEIVGVNTGEKADSNSAKVKEYVEKTTFGDSKGKMTWTVILDSLAEKKGGVKVSNYYGIDIAPEYVLIGRDGNVLKLNPLMSTISDEIENALFPKEEDKNDKELQEVLRKRDAEVQKEIEQYEKERK